MSDRLPTALFVDAQLQILAQRGVYYYFTQKGNESSGLILLKLNGLRGRVKLLAQERDFITDALTWISPLSPEAGEETLAEKDADAYIQRAVDRDPDLWVIEIEDSAMQNPFEI